MQIPSKGLKIFVYQEPVDMRYGFQRLLSFIRDEYSMDQFLAGHVFVFFGRNRFRLKMLLYDGSGTVLLTKRMERGKFMWVHDLDREEISRQEFKQLLHGSVLRNGRLGEMPKR